MKSFFRVFKRTKTSKPKKGKLNYTFYCTFTSPVKGGKDVTLSINQLAETMYGIQEKEVSNKGLAYQIAAEALKRGIVFKAPEEVEKEKQQKKIEKLRLNDYVKLIWDYDNSPYVRKKLREKPNSINRKHTTGIWGAYKTNVIDEKLVKASCLLGSFTPRMAEEIKDDMQNKGKSYSTINKVMQALRTALKFAYQMEILDKDISGRITNVAVNNKERGIPDEDEVKRLLTHLREAYPEGTYERARYLIPALAVCTGMREGEIIALHPKDIVIYDTCGVIHIEHSYNRIDKLKTPKNKKNRTVTVPLHLAKELVAYGEDSPNEFIFYSSRKLENPISPSQILTWFREDFSAVGVSEEELQERNIVFHSLRHYNASVLEDVLTDNERMHRLGHMSKKMTDHYTHKIDARVINEHRKVEEAIPYIS